MTDPSDWLCAVSTAQPLPEKDFKAVIRGGQIVKVGVEFFQNTVSVLWPYLLTHLDQCTHPLGRTGLGYILERIAALWGIPTPGPGRSVSNRS